jgi:sugar phosphate isomerase/epimerase
MTTRLALAVIGDEIGPSLDEMISFCAEQGVKRLDMRTVNGRNLLGMTLDEVAAIGKALGEAGIQVPTFVSPILKWPAPGKAAAGGKVDFAFDPASCPTDDPAQHAFDLATVLGATRIRVFSHLRYDGFEPHDLDAPLDRLLDIGGRHSVTAEMENEPVCNIGSISDLVRFFEDRPESLNLHEVDLPLRPLVDIGNSYGLGVPPTDEEIALLAPLTDLIHLKDRDLAVKRTVPLGDGDIPWAKELERLLKDVSVPEVVASIETHCPGNPRAATARSIEGLRRIAREIGVEVV